MSGKNEVTREDLALAVDNLFGFLADENVLRVLELGAYEGARSLEEITNPTTVQQFLLDFAVAEADYDDNGHRVWELQFSQIGDNIDNLLRAADEYINSFKGVEGPIEDEKREDMEEIGAELHSLVHFLYDYIENKDETLSVIRTLHEAGMDQRFMQGLMENIKGGMKLAAEYSILCDDILHEQHSLIHSNSEVLTYNLEDVKSEDFFEKEKGFMDIDEELWDR